MIWLIAVAGALFDAASKAWAEVALADQSIELAPFLNFQLRYNSGVAFSLFTSPEGATTVYITAITSLLCIGIAWMAAVAQDRIERVAFALVLSGAVGNVIDRVRDGLVTDFISVNAAGWHFPTFNLADVLISFGALLLVLTVLLPSRRVV